MRNGKIMFTYCLVCKGLSNNGVRVGRGPVLQETRPGAGFKTSDFVEEKLRELPQNDSPIGSSFYHGILSPDHGAFNVGIGFL